MRAAIGSGVAEQPRTGRTSSPAAIPGTAILAIGGRAAPGSTDPSAHDRASARRLDAPDHAKGTAPIRRVTAVLVTPANTTGPADRPSGSVLADSCAPPKSRVKTASTSFRALRGSRDKLVSERMRLSLLMMGSGSTRDDEGRACRGSISGESTPGSAFPEKNTPPALTVSSPIEGYARWSIQRRRASIAREVRGLHDPVVSGNSIAQI
jgi:hypothetical protein